MYQFSAYLALLAIVLPDSLAVRIPLTHKDGSVQHLKHRSRASDRFVTTLRTTTYPIVNITIGGQELEMLADTGSPDLWAFSPNSSAKAVGSHAVYDPSKSTGNVQRIPNETFQLVYGSGARVSGPIWKDRVCVGGACVEEAPVGTDETLEENPFGASGILALGLGALSPTQAFKAGTFVQLLRDLPLRILTFVSRQGDGGYIEIGSTDENSYSGNLSRVSLKYTNSFFTKDYTIVSNGLKIGSSTQLFVDSGTPWTALPNNTLAAYASQVEGAIYNVTEERWRYPCSEALPDLDFAFLEGATATIRGQHLSLGPLDDGLAGCQIDIDLGIGYGDPCGNAFFFSNVVVFDYDEPSIYLAPQKL